MRSLHVQLVGLLDEMGRGDGGQGRQGGEGGGSNRCY